MTDELDQDEAAREARDRTLALVTAQLHGLDALELELLQELVDAGPFAQAACTACMTNLCASLFEALATVRGMDLDDYWQTFIAGLVARNEPL